jgi:hypothetical protein
MLAAVRREEQVRSLRARFSSVARTSGVERAADGVLLIAKPDRFRLRLMLPFGITVFDYLNIGEQTWTVLPPPMRRRAIAWGSSRRSRATISARRSCAVGSHSPVSARPHPRRAKRLVSCRAEATCCAARC